jgi:hypothetical protein
VLRAISLFIALDSSFPYPHWNLMDLANCSAMEGIDQGTEPQIPPGPQEGEAEEQAGEEASEEAIEEEYRAKRRRAV